MNQVTSWMAAPAVVGGSSRRPLSCAAAIPAATRTRSWTRASRPMPSTLPIRRSRGRTVVRTTSTTRLCFSSTTPVSTQVPYVKIPMNIRMIPALAKMTAVVCASVGGSSGSTVGGSSFAASAPARRPMTAADVIAWIRFVGLLEHDQLARPGEVGGDVERGVDRLRAQRGLGGRPVRDGADVEGDVVLPGHALDRRPGGRPAACRPARGSATRPGRGGTRAGGSPPPAGTP